MFALNLEKWLSKREAQGQEGIFAKPEKKVSPKTQETTSKLLGMMQKNVGTNDLPSKSSTEQLLTGIYSLMIKNAAEDKLNDELDDDKNDSRHFVAQRRHREILDALAPPSTDGGDNTKAKIKSKFKKIDKDTTKKPKKEKLDKSKPKKSAAGKIALLGGIGAAGLLMSGAASAATNPLESLTGSLGDLANKFKKPAMNPGEDLSPELQKMIVSGHRTKEEQQKIWDASVARANMGKGRVGRTESNYPIAPPGTSKHETGEAIDLPKNLPQWAKDELTSKGWRQVTPIHWEKRGAGMGPVEHSHAEETDKQKAEDKKSTEKSAAKLEKKFAGEPVVFYSSLYKKQESFAKKPNAINITTGQKIDSSSVENKDLHASMNDTPAITQITNNQNVVTSTSQANRPSNKEDDRSAYEKKISLARAQ